MHEASNEMQRPSAHSVDGLVVWRNTQDGNDHSVVVRDGELCLTVRKPDGSEWLRTVKTSCTPQEWLEAYRDLGPTWNQYPGQEVVGEAYHDLRFALTPTECVEWGVHHRKDGTRTVISDTLKNKPRHTVKFVPGGDGENS